MYYPRTLEKPLLSAASSFPAIVLTGPRQSGKTTLLKKLFAQTHRFVSLEDLDIRAAAQEDPRGFLEIYRPPVIIDEIQYVPQLLTYIKTKIDDNRSAGQWLFTGSQLFALMQSVGQSLAGRAAVFNLFSFSMAERLNRGAGSLPAQEFLNNACSSGLPLDMTVEQWLLKGGYPELVVNDINTDTWFSSYVTTYLERDVRQISNVGDMTTFNRFLQLCASLSGKLCNYSSLSSDTGVSLNTIRRWIGILEAGGIITMLPPYYANLGKRLRRTPKLYFLDSGLALFLLGIRSAEDLLGSPSFGPIFETAIVSDWYKRFQHAGDIPRLYHLRTQDGLEADMAIETGGKLHLFEVKSSRTLLPRHASALKRWKKDLGDKVTTGGVIACINELLPIGDGITGIPWHQLAG